MTTTPQEGLHLSVCKIGTSISVVPNLTEALAHDSFFLDVLVFSIRRFGCRDFPGLAPVRRLSRFAFSMDIAVSALSALQGVETFGWRSGE